MRGNRDTNIPADDEADYIVPFETMKVLCDRLNEAYEQFLNSDDGGRASVIKALEFTIEFLRAFEPIRVRTLVAPLVALNNALHALNNNNIHPLLAPATTPGGRPTASYLRLRVKAMSVYGVEVLTAAGVKQQDAYKSVASVLNKHGIKSEGSSKAISQRTVRGWKEDIAADVARKTELSWAFWEYKNSGLTEWFNGLPEKVAVERMLEFIGRFLSQYRAADFR